MCDPHRRNVENSVSPEETQVDKFAVFGRYLSNETPNFNTLLERERVLDQTVANVSLLPSFIAYWGGNVI